MKSSIARAELDSLLRAAGITMPIYETERVSSESPSGESRSGQPASLQPGLNPAAGRIVATGRAHTRRGKGFTEDELEFLMENSIKPRLGRNRRGIK